MFESVDLNFGETLRWLAMGGPLKRLRRGGPSRQMMACTYIRVTRANLISMWPGIYFSAEPCRLIPTRLRTTILDFFNMYRENTSGGLTGPPQWRPSGVGLTRYYKEFKAAVANG
jgi:hypothetical protein